MSDDHERRIRKKLRATYDRMKRRCYNPRDVSYKYYGGRGIRVCAAWKSSFSAFANDLGPPPTLGHSIDRINADGDYEPGNVRWATTKQQTENKSSAYTRRVVENYLKRLDSEYDDGRLRGLTGGEWTGSMLDDEFDDFSL